jgi:hypothetical protein
MAVVSMALNEAEMKSIVTSSLVALAVGLLSANADDSAKIREYTDRMDAEEVVATSLITKLPEDAQRSKGNYCISIDSSHIRIETELIEEIVAIGPAALRPLLREMRRPKVTLDTFARCYSACDQILRSNGLKICVSWRGGLIERKNRMVVGVSRIDGYSDRFRSEQIEEIIERAREIHVTLNRDLR